ncbi:MAG TPA: hypothetical protein VKV17_17875 [Bryobacteraceae bacterium]|nr:hypothetical protein [Bryobacteraceae bacterium]
MKFLQRLWAARGETGDSAAAAPEGEETVNDQKLSAPAAEECAQRLRALRSSHAGIAAESREAESAFKRMQAEITALKSRLADREIEAARSGASAPVEGFEEERQLACAERQGRVMEARVKLFRERVASSQAEIDEAARKLKAAWAEFGEQSYRQALARFREGAEQLRQRYADLLVWQQSFDLLPIPGVLIIEDVSAQGLDRILVNSSIGKGNMQNRIWAPFTRGLRDEIGRLRSELEVGTHEQSQGKE